MNPNTLIIPTAEETAIKNRLLSTGGASPAPANVTNAVNDSYNPQTIMDTYAGARKLTSESAATTAKKLESQYSTAVEDQNIADTQSTTSTLEGQKGFAQMPVALNYMQMSHDKRIRDLTKQKDELLMSNESDKAKSLSDLMIKEQTAMSDARTNFLNNYFNLSKENRDLQSFETPQQKSDRTIADATKQSVLALMQNAPGAGITPNDDYATAISKYKNSTEYKQNIAKGQADINLVNANIVKAKADALKTNNDARMLTGGTNGNYNGEFNATLRLAAQQGGTNDQRKQIMSNLQNFIANKDYPSAYTQILNSTSQGLKGVAATTFQQQQNSLGVLEEMKKAIEAYKAAGGNTNIFKGTVDSVQNKIGALMTDPKYAALAVQLTAAFQNYRLQMTGAAFGEQESAEYATILPSVGNTLDLNLTKLEGAKNYLNSSVNTSIKNVVGPGGVYIKEYAQGAVPQNSEATSTKTLMGPTKFGNFTIPFGGTMQ